MIHATPLITILVAGLGIAFIFGAIAHRLKVSPLVGYLLAGIVIGPATPGYVADQNLASELSEIGVILLMFGVGLHFSLKDLLSVRAIAVPGAIVQIAFATVLGIGIAHFAGWGLGGGIVFGLALSVASTVVLLRAMQDRRLIDTLRGRIAVGWLIVEDLAMVMALVLLPAVAGALGVGTANGTPSLSLVDVGISLGVTLAKVAAFIVLMLVVGRRVIPWLLHRMASTGSRELFRLAVLVIALGVAFGSATLFGVSFALGAFFAGMVMNESELSGQAAQDTLPLRDAFAVLFFVSVGMLFNPSSVIESPLLFVATLLVIVFGKSVAAFGLVLMFGHSKATALTIAASLAQIGEFSFILAPLGVSLGLMPQQGQDLILAAAIVSILLNPFLFMLLDRYFLHDASASASAAADPPEPAPSSGAADDEDEAAIAVAKPAPVAPASGHAVVVGSGRVGALIGEMLAEREVRRVVIEESESVIEALRGKGVSCHLGNAADPETLALADTIEARWLFVAIPNAFEAGQVVEQARKSNPDLQIIARAHSDAEVEHLKARGASRVVMAERETARGMIAEALLPRL
ncbi:YbaL family putative K(+) efflux transporter [Rhodospirillum rubrum]|uniref:Potassium efflux system protein n=1 Tax=Rhodospirillum rubrum (strain ATCC 11170 / ATH 1.1.1 / DSM 467 / LMG 4362 / NCIMB 8255 / S1) TaxID=269796 RepID=Q2RN31_RHORT|nr:YbaL family putative K(+) efflux transporter [Rhodospirillum rubrum]ABC24464.1 Potassium efflux system protein [Rhodospirillum rubrum ATCC 11170]AEO50215.1 potassium efflux system protein [Rhodospirillum rubrum F11]MBK5956190.1 potassium efflux system protein [Rhodospirillum rubrum]QXG80383.1 Kef family K(+) transporter [Rhodospirillum rubrum]HAQ00621.1 Kef family K(+) transporter [Rhodospirillum rubrum]